MTISAQSFRYLSLILVIVTGTLGCGGSKDDPKLGQVSGVVTLDGAPVANAAILFQPPQGRPSTGKTDANGRYELTYSIHSKGALLGHHTVTITDSDDDDDSSGARSKTKIPSIYSSKSSPLSAEINPGENEVNFTLSSNPAK
jgi:hypothetical protein